MPGRTIAICLVLLAMQTSWDLNCCILLGFNFSPYGGLVCNTTAKACYVER